MPCIFCRVGNRCSTTRRFLQRTADSVHLRHRSVSSQRTQTENRRSKRRFEIVQGFYMGSHLYYVFNANNRRTSYWVVTLSAVRDKGPWTPGQWCFLEWKSYTKWNLFSTYYGWGYLDSWPSFISNRNSDLLHRSLYNCRGSYTGEFILWERVRNEPGRGGSGAFENWCELIWSGLQWIFFFPAGENFEKKAFTQTRGYFLI